MSKPNYVPLADFEDATQKVLALRRESAAQAEALAEAEAKERFALQMVENERGARREAVVKLQAELTKAQADTADARECAAHSLKVWREVQAEAAALKAERESWHENAWKTWEEAAQATLDGTRHLHELWQQSQAETAAMREAIEHIYLRQHRYAGEGGPSHLVCAACWQPIEPLNTGIGPKHAADCIVDAALSGTAGQAMLDELAAARDAERVWQEEAMQARQLAATMTDKWQRPQAEAAAASNHVMVVEERLRGVQLQRDEYSAEAAAMREEVEQILEGAAGNAGECMDCDSIAVVAARALAGTAGQALLDELARLRLVVEAALVARRQRGCDRSPHIQYEVGDGLCDICKVVQLCIALAALDAGRGEEANAIEPR